MATDSGHKRTKSGQSKKKHDRLTAREKALFKELLSGKHKFINSALIAAGYSESTANKQAKQILGKPRIISALQSAMEKRGISDDFLMGKLLEGLEATRTISTISGNEANGGTVDFVEVPDFQARHKYLDTTLKIRGDYAPEKHEHELPSEITLNINFSGGNDGDKR